jgi:uncharacterized membrane protein
MNDNQTRKFEDLLVKLEVTALSLQQSVESIEEALASRGIYPAQAQPPAVSNPQPAIPPPPGVRDAVFCVHCNGGNPPETAKCIWCGQPVRTVQIAIPPEIRAGAQAPATSIPVDAPGAREAESAALSQVSHQMAAMRRVPAPTDRPAITLSQARESKQAGQVLPARAATPDPDTASHMSFDFLSTTDFWLNKVGIGLLLLGVIFLFKYSVDQGWLTPMLRVATGLVIGTALAMAGMQLGGKRPALSQVLIGGSIAAYYSSGFAAFQLYHLVDYIPAFGFMSAVTVFAFVYSLRQDNVLFSIIGVLGSLATPFLLRTEAPSLSGLVLYTCLIMAATGAIYLLKGWRSLLWTSLLGALMVLAAGYASAVTVMQAANATSLQPSDRWAFQAGLVAYLIAFWLLPVARELMWLRDPARWPRPVVDTSALQLAMQDDAVLAENHLHYLIVGVPFVTLFFSWRIWPEITNQTAGLLVLLASGAMVLAYLGLRRLEAKVAYTHLMMALALLTLGIFLIGDAQALPLAFALEAAALHLIARRLGDRGISLTAHAVSLLSWLLVFNRLAGPYFDLPQGATPLFNPNSLAALAVLVLTIGISFIVSPRPVAAVYRGVAHLLFLMWLVRDWHGLPSGNGAAVIMIVSSIYAIGLFYYSQRTGEESEGAIAHLIFGGLGCTIVWWIMAGWAFDLYDRSDLFTPNALAALLVIAAAAAVSLRMQPPSFAWAYRLAAHGALLAWLWYELSIPANGNSYVSISWGVYALALLWAGMHLGKHTLVLRMGLGTLLLVVGKLFVVDLAAVEPIWRIALFLGFGVVFLVLSYFFQGAVRSNNAAVSPEPKGVGTEGRA